MAKSYRKKSKKHSKKSLRKGSKRSSGKRSKKHSRKHSRRLGRIKVNPNNTCSMRSKARCGGDPNCHYVKYRGCSRRSGVKQGIAYEGPMMP